MHYSLRKVFSYYMYARRNSDIDYTFHNVPLSNSCHQYEECVWRVDVISKLFLK